ncbi:hypothetical protein QJS10_CPB11g00304 [Acorus calamus]|uniref:Uncharacterized protein n=1 Tax=Acorus calamus TaxID=4465 RepID=A0AAV9DZF2_ACOCL|nr:hypothetical protein QJS10_CPB11g00304 [Acorus calamus]
MAEPDHAFTLPQETQPNPSKYFSQFLYKAFFVAVFLSLLPLLPSQAPDFVINHTIFTRSWELLHLLFVGITVSYGLFSRRNPDEIEKETPSKSPDFSTILQVSSFFDNDAEGPIGSIADEKVQSWNSQYYRGEPVVVVERESAGDGGGGDRPLFLPVRSLKSVEESKSFNGSSEKPSEDLREVRPSPIPWRSRSERMNFVDDDDDDDESGNITFAPQSVESPSKRSTVPPHSRQRSSASPSPKKLSPSPSIEDPVKRKSFYRPPPPAPPPPPPPTTTRKSPLFSVKHEPGIINYSKTAPKPNTQIESSSIGKSVRTVRATEITNKDKFFERRRPPSMPDIKYEEEKINLDLEETESDDDDVVLGGESSDGEEKVTAVAESVKEAATVVANENEVDKKADEFIAKFREQIRLQRIESIKKTTGQRRSKSMR